MAAGQWLAAHPYVQTVLNDHPSLYWSLGETSGTNAADISGYGRTGTYTGGYTLGAAGAMTTASATGVDLDGINGRVLSTYSPFVNGTIRTFEGCAYHDTDQTGTLFGGSAGYTAAPLFLWNSGGNGSFYLNNTGAASATWVNPWPGLTQWVDWALVFDEPGDTAELFVNGVSKGQQAVTDQYQVGSGTFDIGRTTLDGGTLFFPFDGKLDEVAVYDYALSATRIAAHHTARTT